MTWQDDEKKEAEKLYQMSVNLRNWGYREVKPPLPGSMVEGGALCYDELAEKYWQVFGMGIEATEVQHDIEEMAAVTNMNFRAQGAVHLAQAYDLPGIRSQLGCSGPVYEKNQ